MNDHLKYAIQTAAEAAELAANYKQETYLAVLLSSLMNTDVEGEAVRNAAPRPKNISTACGKQLSPGELFAAKGWKTDLDKVILAGFYLEKNGGLQSFSLQDVRNTLIAAKVTLPKNVSLALFKAVQRGWVMEVSGARDDLKAWVLTQSGEKRVVELEK